MLVLFPALASGGDPAPVELEAVLDGDLALASYFEQNVTGGPASFVMTARTLEDFAEAMRKKLLRENLNPMASAHRS